MATAPDPKDTGSFLWNVHAYLNAYIRFADAKAQLVIGWTSAIVGALLASKFPERFSCSTSGLLAVAGSLCLVTAFAFAFVAVVPRLSTTQLPGFIFWKSILAHCTKDRFVKAIGEQSAAELNNHLAGHLFDLSNVGNQKFEWVNRSIVLAFIGSVITGAVFLWAPK
jgi:hypothetical protein